MKILVVVILVAILVSLGSALVFLVKDGGKTKRTVNALTVRISLSLALFLFLMFGYYMGWFVPNHGPV
ncbi:MAG: twin transrane helix small protein [Betaproteobacteria bacterium]|nr:twin transrane helix small protein [Betaproteobacteria bacterium]